MNSENLKNIQTNSDEISLKELILKIRTLFSYLLSKWIIILFFGFIGGILGFFYSYYKKPVYKAELSFALEDEKSGGGVSGALGLASQLGFDVGGNGGGAFSGDNLLELMKSRSMVEKALLTSVDIEGKKQTLAEFYINYKGLRENWKNNPKLIDLHFFPGADRIKFSFQQDSLLGVFHDEIISRSLTVDKLDKKLSIVVLKVNSENEIFSKYFAEILTKEVSDFYVETKTKKSVENLAVLVHQTDSVRRALNSAISGVASSIDANPNANPARQVLRVPSQKRQVDVQANTAILTELVKNVEISKVSLRKETPLIQIIDKPILPLDVEKSSKKLSVLIGFCLSIVIGCIILIFNKFFKDLLNED